MAEAGEFQIIEKFFTYQTFGAWKSQGVGDDCAIIDTGAGRIAVTCDMMALGTHFLPDADPEDVGYKALAVNLSDLAAAGAVPRAFFLSIGLPRRDDGWLADFFARPHEARARVGLAPFSGASTTRTPEVQGRHAPVTISITAMGDLPAGMGLTRKGAKPGDDIWVSGTVGDAYAALKCRWGAWSVMPDLEPELFARMDRPTPRIALGQALLGAASAAADISDGLLADLGHILERSGVSAEIEWEKIPTSVALQSMTPARQHEAALAGGDDYELIFTAPPSSAERIYEAGLLSGTPVTRIGRVIERTSRAVTVRTPDGLPVLLVTEGFDHFRNEE
ncbi:thiamine-phosphate kinase [Sutterella seckii]|uniref:Thiamine-monophosphate kinase n=1 Tax=Sutterella seckii TaxID=1944635 RepID=A0A6I1EJD8_9BURK|nr:thiamine-phosphate kinase [Sutterella seckii]KAB7658262.1 thiamine-phosphate kinase [Sutterella seckii]